MRLRAAKPIEERGAGLAISEKGFEVLSVITLVDSRRRVVGKDVVVFGAQRGTLRSAGFRVPRREALASKTNVIARIREEVCKQTGIPSSWPTYPRKCNR